MFAWVSSKSALALVLAFLMAGTGFPRTGMADGKTAVRVPWETLATPVSRADLPGVKTLGEVVRSLDVYANGQLCGRMALATPGHAATADVVFELGSAGQPTACSTEGATLTFIDANGSTLYEKLKLQKGVHIQLTNLAPEAPSTGASPGAPATGTGTDSNASTGAGDLTRAATVLAGALAFVCLLGLMARRRGRANGPRC
ncbi:MAG: hypothetical protein KJ053_02405 [Dehalococcoidia bacterium]|nr:hypothetical protein [Dehalococcoidia bacterium]